VTSDAVLVAEEQARTAARLRGATQALNVLLYRSPADQQRASQDHVTRGSKRRIAI